MGLFGDPANKQGHLTLIPPPSRGYRVIPGAVWWKLIWWPWRRYLVARRRSIIFPPPTLAPRGSGTYFTDYDSLQGYTTPAEIATRVCLPGQADAECQRYGCAVVEFRVPAPSLVVYGVPYPGDPQGLTSEGAREWIVPGEIPLHSSMRVTYIDLATEFTLPL